MKTIAFNLTLAQAILLHDDLIATTMAGEESLEKERRELLDIDKKLGIADRLVTSMKKHLTIQIAAEERCLKEIGELKAAVKEQLDKQATLEEQEAAREEETVEEGPVG